MIKNIIWDFDGTLFNTYPGTTKAFILALDEKGIKADYEEVMSLLKNSFSHAIEKYNLDESFIDDLNRMLPNIDINEFKPFKYSREICEIILNRGGKNYLVTHRGNSTYWILKLFSFEKYFEDILTSSENYNRKPDTEMYEIIINRNNINVNETMIVGDRELDILPAKELNIKSCLIIRDKDMSISTQADYVFESLEGLLKMLERRV